MHKIFTLAIAASFLPLSQQFKIATSPLEKDRAAVNWLFKCKITTPVFFEPQKKTAEPWSPNWMATAQENIRKSEYHFKWEEKLNAYCTPNRKNNLRFFYNDNGFAVEPRTTQIPMSEFDPIAMSEEKKYPGVRQAGRSITNQPTAQAGWKIKFNLDKNQIGKGLWKVSENTAEYVTNKITVQYINNDDGMRQNFIVGSPLSNNKELNINFSIKTKLKILVRNDKLQFFHQETNVLNYEQLKVWDANGKPLEASFKKNKTDQYSVKVMVAGAAFPVTIDPLSATPNSTPDDADQADAQFGASVASAGDVNGDGYSDVIIGAAPYDEGANTNEGRAFVYYGSASGLPATPSNTPDDANQANALFGCSVASAGDVNGDGYSDVIIGAFLFDDGVITDEGRAYVYHGSAGGLGASPVGIADDANQASSGFGRSASCAGDINGDGFSDVIIGALLYDDGANTDEGRAFIYYGSATGIGAAPVNTPDDADQANAQFGFSVSGAGDVNGDGFSDVIIGAYAYDDGANTDEGRAFVYHGSAGGLSASPNNIPDDANQSTAYFGRSVASAGDVNGDGYSDVIIGAHQYDDGINTNEGRVFVYHGSLTGLSASPASTPDDANQSDALFGVSVACAGDVNGDGYSDVIIGAADYDGTDTDEGGSFVYHGSASGLPATPNSILEDANQFLAESGCSVASAGDVNGDGYSDVIIGAWVYDDGANTNEGRAFVYHGGAAGLNPTPNSTPDDADQASANFGRSVASAGDVNGDGYSDVIIGAWTYDDGANADEGRVFVYHGSAIGLSATPSSTPDDADQAGAAFGFSVAGAGDINGDGYSDVIIGAAGYDDGANAGEGRGFVYNGSATGLSSIPNSTPDDADQAGASFGSNVAGAGDVNGDGYSDVIIGADFYDDAPNFNEGRCFVYHGSATGLSTTPNSTPDDGNQGAIFFGCSVASAGDVNGDGYSDVIIGAYSYNDGPNTDEGRAFVYHGSATGLSASPNSTPNGANQADAFFGISVAGAGDVNGDGYGDVIIGAYQYDDGANMSEGRAFVYHGSATGLLAAPSSTPDDANQGFAYFGYYVAGAGDVNGDGYSDVLIVAPSYDDGANTNEGRGFMYHGSATGLSATPNSTPDDADQASPGFGPVASAGDVNGDGYSDIIIGAYLYDDGANSDEGRVFLYNGNEFTANKRNNLRLYNNDLATPINSSNFIFGNFGAGLFAKSFLGRDSGKMVWETRLNYNAYSGTPITNSTFFTAQQPSYTDMGLAGVEIKNLVTKLLGGYYTKLRVRVKYKPLKAITGQVYGPWRNVSSIIDANRLGVLPVELISFNAAWLQKGKTARLDFKTDKENGICCFDIEKSSDGFNFYSIGTLPAKNTAGIQQYNFVDNNAKNKNQYYRLKIKGIAGQMDYSNIQQLQNEKATEILVFPNPTTDVLQLQLNKSYDKINVQVTNVAGQMVKQLTIPASNQVITIPVQNLPAGKYWLQLQNGKEKQTLQFIKQ